MRRDVERLRLLGYPVDAVPGTAGYRLGAGAALPPLLLEDDEAVAVALGLRTAAGGSVTGIEESSLRALTKLEQVLPSRLRHRVSTLQSATVLVGAAGPPVSPDVLTAIADAIRRREGLRFDYVSPRGGPSRRAADPHRLASWGRHWDLVAWDTERAGWRSFRVDRLALRTPNGPRFSPRELPDGDDVVGWLSRQLSSSAWQVRAVVILHEPLPSVADRIWPGMGALEAIDDSSSSSSCRLHVGAQTPRDLMWMITSVDADVTVVDGPPELAAAFRVQAERCARAGAGAAA